jgi:hypothetical protein
MRKKPTIITDKIPELEGVDRKLDKVYFESTSGNRYLSREVETVSISNKTPVKNIPKDMNFGSSLEDYFQYIEEVAINVLEEAGMPTDIVYTKTKHKESWTSPQVKVERELSKYCDEYKAAMVLHHVRSAESSINNNDAHSAAYHSLKAGLWNQQLLVNDYAYAVGLETTKPKKGKTDKWISIAKDIMKKEGISIKILLDKKNREKWTIPKLSKMISLKTEGDNEKSIENALREYFKN